MGGVKHDSNKSRVDLISPIALEDLGMVLKHGVAKYGEHNWRGGIAWSRLIGASLRHLLAFMRGEDLDPESGLSHVSHAMCNLMMLGEFIHTRPDLDDRYFSKKSSDIAC